MTTIGNAPQTISIDDVEYIRADSVTTKPDPTGEVRIVVLQRGWVVIGYYTEDGDEVTVEQASVIRVWGTTKGLGELVDGPTKNTVLDYAGVVRAHRGAVVLTIDADDYAWLGKL
jgi:hypothetical protein